MSNEMIIEKTKQLLSGHCAAELRPAALAYLEAIGTDAEQAATNEYIFQLEDAIMPIDSLIGFSASEAGKNLFGEETAAGINAHALEVKAEGGQWCDCPACTLAIEILGMFDDEEGDAGQIILEYEDDTKEECDIVGLIEIGDKTCIVLLPTEKPEEGVLIYGYKSIDEENFELYDLTDEEFQAASDKFMNPTV